MMRQKQTDNRVPWKLQQPTYQLLFKQFRDPLFVAALLAWYVGYPRMPASLGRSVRKRQRGVFP